MGETESIPVALAPCRDYSRPELEAVLESLLTAVAPDIARGVRVLIKPNLVSARKGALACSEPAFIAALCEKFIDLGAHVLVADSPAFGTAAGVAKRCGLAMALKPLGVRISSLGRPTPVKLSFGRRIGVSRDALEAGLIISAPRLKAHCQMRISACVKNLFGCTPGMRKALAHHRFGERGNCFEAMILDIAQALPPLFSVLDAITAMHVTGPSSGPPVHLGFMAAGDPFAVDTAVYGMLGLTPGEVALWREARDRGLPGAFAENLDFPLMRTGEFDCSGFRVPDRLEKVSFNPWRLGIGAMKRFRERLRG